MLNYKGDYRKMLIDKELGLNVITKGNESPKGKAKVYITCHEGDDWRIDKICKLLFEYHDCAIYFLNKTNEGCERLYEESFLGSMRLFIIIVSEKILNNPCRAMQKDFVFAKKTNIPILPIIVEFGLSSEYSKPNNFGDMQYLRISDTDSTAIGYADKLKKYLDEILIDDDVERRIKNSFDSYIFLSYRKKDRQYANDLMKMLHNNYKYQDIAIWYDEFLTLGESYTENIKESISKCNLFVLLVTRHALEDVDGKPNYVERIEYPLAKELNSSILAIMMENVDCIELLHHYPELPQWIDISCDSDAYHQIEIELEKIEKPDDEENLEHKYLIGLAYLNGIDVEKDYIRALKLIREAAESGFVEAMIKLSDIYANNIGIETDWNEALKWIEKTIEAQTLEYSKKPNNEVGRALYTSLIKKYEYCTSFEMYQTCIEIGSVLISLAREVFGECSLECISSFTIRLNALYKLNIQEYDFHEEIDYINSISLYVLNEPNKIIYDAYYSFWTAYLLMLNICDHSIAMECLVATEKLLGDNVEFRDELDILKSQLNNDNTKLVALYKDKYIKFKQRKIDTIDSLDILWRLLNACYESGAYIDAIKYSEDYEYKTHRLFIRPNPEYYYLAGLCYEKVCLFDKAIEKYREGLLFFSNRCIENGVARGLWYKANCLFAMHDYQNAKNTYQDLLNINQCKYVDLNIDYYLIKACICLCNAYIDDPMNALVEIEEIIIEYTNVKMYSEISSAVLGKYADILYLNKMYSSAKNYYVLVKESTTNKDDIIISDLNIAKCDINENDENISAYSAVFDYIYKEHTLGRRFDAKVYIKLHEYAEALLMNDEFERAVKILNFIIEVLRNLLGPQSIPSYTYELEKMILFMLNKDYETARIISLGSNKMYKNWYEEQLLEKRIDYFCGKRNYFLLCFLLMNITKYYNNWAETNDSENSTTRSLIFLECAKKSYPYLLKGDIDHSLQELQYAIDFYLSIYNEYNMSEDSHRYNRLFDSVWNIELCYIMCEKPCNALVFATRMLCENFRNVTDIKDLELNIYSCFKYINIVLNQSDKLVLSDLDFEVSENDIKTLIELADAEYARSEYKVAEDILSSLVLAGSHEAQRKAGILNTKGKYHDFEKAELYLKKSIENGSEKSVVALFGLYLENDIERAITYLKDRKDDPRLNKFTYLLFDNNGVLLNDEIIKEKFKTQLLKYTVEELESEIPLASTAGCRYTRISAKTTFDKEKKWVIDIYVYRLEYWSLVSPEEYYYTYMA